MWHPRGSWLRVRGISSALSVDASFSATTMPVCMPLHSSSCLVTDASQKHYCDYCDVFLTHDSASGKHTTGGCSHADTHVVLIVRKAHNNGRNHLANVRDYYACARLAFSLTHILTHPQL